MTNPTTEPGLGGPAPASSGSDTMPDASPSPPAAASFDDAMRVAELRVAEAHNREIVDREAERRRVHLDTTAKLRGVEKGSEAHFALLALRQEWTLPLDDDDYVLWMQRHLLQQHGKAMADEVSQKRRAKAKAMARGPAMVIAVAAGLATVAGIGWWLRGSSDRRAAAPPEATIELAPPPAEKVSATAAYEALRKLEAEAPTTTPVPAKAAASGASSAGPAPSAAAAAAPSAPPAASARPGNPGGAPKGGGPGKPAAPKPDLWEREF